MLNRPLENDSGGVRPAFAGAISFQDVTFNYSSNRPPALEKVSFSIPEGTMLGVVGRSGSGKSTIARLLQGINRDYSGFIKIDGADLREINLRHLRQSLGVVLQENFLFRGTIRDNIIAGRPGLTLSDAMQAARLAGAEEFIECMPNGYENSHRRRVTESFRRAKTTARDRARINSRSAHPGSRRGDECARSAERGRAERQSAAHHDHRLTSFGEPDRLRQHSGDGARQGRRLCPA